eukprot:7255778-Pyramimonas_sp.AAC.1
MPKSGRAPAVESKLIEELCKHIFKDKFNDDLLKEVLRNRCCVQDAMGELLVKSALMPDDGSGLLDGAMEDEGLAEELRSVKGQMLQLKAKRLAKGSALRSAASPPSGPHVPAAAHHERKP